MKVTFEKEIDLSQVPFEINKIFKENLSRLTTLNSMLQDLDPTSPAQFVEKLDFVRTKLFEIDASFDECASQMRGYIIAVENDGADVPLSTESSQKLEEVNDSLTEFEKNMKNIMEATHKGGLHTSAPLSMPDPSEILKQMKTGGENET